MTGVSVNQLLEKIGQLIDKKIGRDFQQPEKQNQTKYISRAEVAKLLKITLPTLNDWTKLGRLQSYKIGTRVLYKLHEVEGSIDKLATYKYRKGGNKHGA